MRRASNKLVASWLQCDLSISPPPRHPSPPPPQSSAVNGQLTVTTLPDVLFQNNSGVHNIVEGSVIWLYCTADSTTASITWTKDGETLVNDPPHIRIRSSNDTLLSTTSSLVVDNFQATDNGVYLCQASDGTETTSSSTLSLTGRQANSSTSRMISVSLSVVN